MYIFGGSTIATYVKFAISQKIEYLQKCPFYTLFSVSWWTHFYENLCHSCIVLVFSWSPLASPFYWINSRHYNRGGDKTSKVRLWYAKELPEYCNESRAIARDSCNILADLWHTTTGLWYDNLPHPLISFWYISSKNVIKSDAMKRFYFFKEVFYMFATYSMIIQLEVNNLLFVVCDKPLFENLQPVDL